MQRLCAHHFTAIVMVLILFAGPVQVFGSIRSAAMAQARRAQQEQMKQQAAEQKAMAEAEQKAAAAEAAEEQRKQDAHTGKTGSGSGNRQTKGRELDERKNGQSRKSRQNNNSNQIQARELMWNRNLRSAHIRD